MLSPHKDEVISSLVGILMSPLRYSEGIISPKRLNGEDNGIEDFGDMYKPLLNKYIIDTKKRIVS